MNKARRSAVIFFGFFAIFSIYLVRLVQLQLVRGDYYAALSEQGRSSVRNVSAARGAILDRDGTVLVQDRVGFSLVLDGAWLPAEDINTVIAALTDRLAEMGETWNDRLPLSEEPPWTVTESKSLYAHLSLTSDATADEVLAACAARYGIATENKQLCRRLAGIRYTMELTGFNRTMPFVLATDVSRETAAFVEAHPDRFLGVRVEKAPVREYVCGTVAAHLIGTVGPIFAEEYETLRSQGYQLTDTVGKSGLEAALESTLRGKVGQRTYVWNKQGTVEKVHETTSAVAGNSVQLTIDSRLQETAQTVLEDTIEQLRKKIPTEEESYVGQDVQSGSAVLLDVRTGGILVAASAPGFDLSTYRDTAVELLNDPQKPLFNRVLFGTFPCGSVIKPAVAVAALSEGIVSSQQELITCDGVYHYYESVGFAPKCLGKHGKVSLTKALQRSCNVYFFDLGRLLGIERMNGYLQAFGLGQSTGVELSETVGVLASPDTKKGTWVAGDTCQCAIGQMDQRFTPLQLAAYAMTLANRGVRYRTHLVGQVLCYDGTVVEETQPQVVSVVQADDSVFEEVQRGMEAVVNRGGTAYAAFAGVNYTVAAKTGTAQNSRTRSDHGIFIGYAPLEDPQVAVAVVMENGTSAPAAAVARALLDVYFEQPAV